MSVYLTGEVASWCSPYSSMAARSRPDSARTGSGRHSVRMLLLLLLLPDMGVGVDVGVGAGGEGDDGSDSIEVILREIVE